MGARAPALPHAAHWFDSSYLINYLPFPCFLGRLGHRTSYDLQPTPFHAHATPIARSHTPQSLFRTISGIQVLLPSTTRYPFWGPRSLISSRSGSYPCPAGAAASLLEGGRGLSSLSTSAPLSGRDVGGGGRGGVNPWVRILPSSFALQMVSPGRGLCLKLYLRIAGWSYHRGFWFVKWVPENEDIRIGEEISDMESGSLVSSEDLGQRELSFGFWKRVRRTC